MKRSNVVAGGVQPPPGSLSTGADASRWRYTTTVDAALSAVISVVAGGNVANRVPKEITRIGNCQRNPLGKDAGQERSKTVSGHIPFLALGQV